MVDATKESPVLRCQTTLSAEVFVEGTTPISGQNFLIAELAEIPGTVVIDFPDRRTMALAFERMTLYAGRFNKLWMPATADMDTIRAANGRSCADPHDRSCGMFDTHVFSIDDIVPFCTAIQQGKDHTAEEDMLCGALSEIKATVFAQGCTLVPAGYFAVMALHRGASVQERLAFFQHAAMHSAFVVDDAFAQRVAQVMTSLTPNERQLIHESIVATGLYHSNNYPQIARAALAYFGTQHPLLSEGPVMTMMGAARRCIDQMEECSCKAVRRFSGNVQRLLTKMHDRFWAIAACRVPLLANAVVEDNQLHVTALPDSCQRHNPQALQRFANDPTAAALLRKGPRRLEAAAHEKTLARCHAAEVRGASLAEFGIAPLIAGSAAVLALITRPLTWALPQWAAPGLCETLMPPPLTAVIDHHFAVLQAFVDHPAVR